MKKSKEDLLEQVNSSTDEELRRMAFAFLRIREHIWREFETLEKSESRKREKSRLKIAQKHITNWYNEF
jgi:DNA repair photolyase